MEQKRMRIGFVADYLNSEYSDNCIINYTLADNHIEIEHGNKNCIYKIYTT